MKRRAHILFVSIIAFVAHAHAAFARETWAEIGREPGPVEPPLAGQPMNFSGAIGSYAIATRAEPTVLQSEDPLTLTIRITVTGAGSFEQMRRPNLGKIEQFARHFAIQNGKERDLPKEKAREFDYVLRPRNADVKQVPAVPFVYFNPAIVPAGKGYQWTYARAIPLTVKPRSAVSSVQIKASSPAAIPPDSVLQVATGAQVLRREVVFSRPGWETMLVLAFVPPVACGAWVVARRRLHPDAAHVAKQRRSRAARVALKAISSAEALPDEEQLPRVKEALEEYLRERFDLGVYEPTPLEISAHLQQKGVSAISVQKASLFFRACDAARFAPEPPSTKENGTSGATGLVQTLEEESWPLQAP